MLKNEILEKLKDIDDNTDITEETLGFAKPKFDVNNISLDEYKELLANNKEIKGYYTSSVDSKVSKGIESWKKNNLEKIVEERIKAKSTEGLTEEQKQLRELQEQIEKMKQEKAQAELLESNRKKLKDNNLSEDLAKYIKADEDIEFFKNLITNSVNAGVQEKIKTNNYTPPSENNLGGGKITWDMVIENPSLLGQYQAQK